MPESRGGDNQAAPDNGPDSTSGETSAVAQQAGGGLVAAALALVVVAARLLAGRVAWAAACSERVARHRTPITLALAGTAMVGSLYFSEVAHYVPCRLCWFQRIAMYPIALIALVALLRRDQGARWYMVPLAVIGGAISIYHYLIEWNPSLEGGACGLFGPACADIWFREFGFVTLAFMALAGFTFVVVVNTVSFASVRPPEELP